jgi:ADP-ribosylglycohydrolase
MKAERNYYKDVLFGIAIGDAFGAGLEFQDRDWIRQNVDFTKFINQRNDIKLVINDFGNMVNNYNAWDYTDDAEMTIGCVKAILSGEEFSEDLLLKYWQNEYFEDKKRKGIGRHGHGAMRWLYSGEKTIEEIREFQANRPNPGNAPPMRAIPFGFVNPYLIDRYATINANTTHPNPKAVAASISIARATEFMILTEGNQKEIIQYCADYVKLLDHEFYNKLILADKLPSPKNLKEEEYELLCGQQPIVKSWFPEGIKGLPTDAMYTAISALYILKYAEDTFDGFKEAILIGGDVDSLASIVTGILAGKHGLSSLPDYMKTEVEGIEMLEMLGKEWSEFYNSQKS